MRSVLIVLFVYASALNAQPPYGFFSTFGGEGDDVGRSAKQTVEGDYIVAGSSNTWGSHGLNDACIIRVDNAGFPSWTKYIGGSGIDVAQSIIQLPDSGFIFTGFTNSSGLGGYDVYLVRTNKLGDSLWTRTWGGNDWEYGFDLVLGSDNNVYVVGNTASFGEGQIDAFILKFDLNGNLIKQKTYGGLEIDDFRAIIKTNDNKIAVVGMTQSFGDSEGDAWFLKLDLNLDTVFTLRLGGQFSDLANDLVQNSSGQYIIAAGNTYSVNTKSKSYMYCMDATGNFIWENSYYHSVDDESFVSVCNNLLDPTLAGFLKNIPVQDLGQQGNIFVSSPGGWAHVVNSFGGTENETFYSLEGTSDGGYLAVGSSNSFNSNGQDVFLIKLDSSCNYTSVVGLKEPTRSVNAVRVLQDDKRVKFEFGGVNLPADLRVFDLNGSEIFHEKLSTKASCTFSCDNVSQGIYVVRVIDSDGKSLHRKFFLK